MKIGIDARSLVGNRGGVGRYLSNLLRNLIEIDSENEYVLYSHRELDMEVLNRQNVREREIDLPLARSYFAWLQVRLPLELMSERVDVVHFPFYTMPLVVNSRSVVTIHDITFELYPQWFSLKGKIAQIPFCRLAAKKADMVIACSETTKNDIQRVYSIPEDRIEVVYEAADPKFRLIPKDEALERVRSTYEIHDRFLLYVGMIHRRRNIERLLRAFSLFGKTHREYQLVLIGKIEWPFLDVSRLVDELGLRGRVIHLGYVDDRILPFMYCAAEAFVYPSFYEGFGLPVLEAMACGTPVITSDNSSLSELFSGAALLIDPLSVGEMEEAMMLLVEDGRLKGDLVSRGVQRVKEFSWRVSAEKTLRVYRKAARVSPEGRR